MFFRVSNNCNHIFLVVYLLNKIFTVRNSTHNCGCKQFQAKKTAIIMHMDKTSTVATNGASTLIVKLSRYWAITRSMNFQYFTKLFNPTICCYLLMIKFTRYPMYRTLGHLPYAMFIFIEFLNDYFQLRSSVCLYVHMVQIWQLQFNPLPIIQLS